MKWIGSFFGIVVGVAILVVAAQLLGVVDLIRESMIAGHLLDWLTGVFCLLWLLLILKAPWDLYFKAHAVAFEQQRSQERGIRLETGRTQYIQTVRRRLLLFAIGAHAGSAALVAAVTFFTHGTVGYWFAAFYLIATLFRPGIAAYAYLWERLKAIGEESRYPREDVGELRQRLAQMEQALDQYREELRTAERTATDQQTVLDTLQFEKQREINDLHQRLTAISQEFERTIARLTDNQEVINGLQAFVRLIARSAVRE